MRTIVGAPDQLPLAKALLTDPRPGERASPVEAHHDKGLGHRQSEMKGSCILASMKRDLRP